MCTLLSFTVFDPELLERMVDMPDVLVASASDAVLTEDLLSAVLLTNRLLALIFALLVLIVIFGLMRFFIRIVERNITNYM